MPAKPEPEPIFFESPEEFYAWLDEHHESASEVYVGYWKKHTGRPSLTWSQAVDQALCFGWIDTRVNRIDDDRHMQRFTPRKPGSNWSNINIEKMQKLTEAGLVKPAGLAAFEKRRDDRTGVYSFERSEQAQLEPEQEERFKANAGAWEFFQSQAPWYRRTAIHLVTSAKKPETRERRLNQLIEDSAAGRRLNQLTAPGRRKR
jgi:uncharacterized protein YdeI (YjbR/CyaY-like superfamily)